MICSSCVMVTLDNRQRSASSSSFYLQDPAAALKKKNQIRAFKNATSFRLDIVTGTLNKNLLTA